MPRPRPPKSNRHGTPGDPADLGAEQRTFEDRGAPADPNAPTRVIRQGGEELDAHPRPGGPRGDEADRGEGPAPGADAQDEPSTGPRPSGAARISGLGSGLLARQPTPSPGEGVTVRKVCPHCGTEYETDARFCPKDGAALRPIGGTDPLIGHILGDRYHILSLVGEGGMGRIYLAEHVRMSRQCAVKIMRPNLMNDPDAAARFAREASSAARIIHPNVAAVFDYGESDGRIYLVMEFVDGEPLGSILERERVLSAPRATEIARQVADALAAAHDLGIVHRDLKPDNILITRSKSGKEIAKVVDFGIAKALEEGPGQKLTETGLVIGTPEFMSPEQLMGDPVDARSDVYSLGCILYLTLVGVPAADAPTREGMLKRRLNESAPHPRSANETLPPELDQIVATCLAPSPENRYQSAAELREALAAVPLPQAEAVPANVPDPSSREKEPASGEESGIPGGAWLRGRRGLGTAGVLMLAVIVFFFMKTDRGADGAGVAPAILSADSVGGLAQPGIKAAPGSPEAADTLPPAGLSGLTTPTADTVAPPARTPAQVARADSIRRTTDATAALRRALQPAISRFAAAVSSRDIEALRAAYPGLTPNQERVWRANFSQFERIQTSVRYGASATDADGRARQHFRLALTYVDRQGISTSSAVDYIARYERAGSQWVLRSLEQQ